MLAFYNTGSNKSSTSVSVHYRIRIIAVKINPHRVHCKHLNSDSNHQHYGYKGLRVYKQLLPATTVDSSVCVSGEINIRSSLSIPTMTLLIKRYLGPFQDLNFFLNFCKKKMNKKAFLNFN